MAWPPLWLRRDDEDRRCTLHSSSTVTFDRYTDGSSTCTDVCRYHCRRDSDRFFDSKVADVRASTSDDPPPSFSAAPLGCVLPAFRPLTVADVVTAVRLLPDKPRNSDPLPTRLHKVNIDVLAPFLVELFYRSLTLGVVRNITNMHIFVMFYESNNLLCKLNV